MSKKMDGGENWEVNGFTPVNIRSYEMDPEEALRRIRALADDYDRNADNWDESEFGSTLAAITKTFQGLDTWLSSGGFPPNAWSPIKVQPDQDDFRITLFNEFVRVWRLSGRTRKTKLEAAGKTCEEVGEMMQAVLCETGAHLCDYKGLGEADVVSETADIVQCAISVAERYGTTVEDWFRMLKKENDKWERRLDEHEREDRAQNTGG